MHLNPQYPNILADMQAAANGRDLRDKRQVATGMFALTAKRHLVPCKSYPYTSKRQVKRQQSRATTCRGLIGECINCIWPRCEPQAETGN